MLTFAGELERRYSQMILEVNRLFNMIKGHGWAGRMVPIDHLVDLQEAIRSNYTLGLIHEAFYHEQLASFCFDLPSDLPTAQSIIIVAVPTPPMRVVFHWRGKRVPIIIPPTYVSYTPRTENVQTVLEEWLQFEGYHLAKPQLPLKTLAVGSGLADYGRNNICYVPGMGSYLQLIGAFSDISCDGDSWREPKALDRCQSCTACLRLCPTGAITNNRFLLHAERCLTYHNEAAADFPSWIDPAWHHCLIGCLRCQAACPENKALLNWFEDRAEFSEPETSWFVQSVPIDLLPEKTATKIKGLQINEDYRLLCRNLSIMLAQEPVPHWK